MFLKVLLTCLLPCIVRSHENETTVAPSNTTSPVNEISGVQEALTIFKTNGSTLNITTPLIGNVTVDSLMGVAPLLFSNKNVTLPQFKASNETTPETNTTTATEVGVNKPQVKLTPMELASKKLAEAEIQP